MVIPMPLAAAAVLWAAASVAHAGPDEPRDLPAELRSVLLARPLPPERTEAEFLGELAALGPEVVPQLFALFAGGEELDRLLEVEGVPPEDVRWWGRPDRFGDYAATVLATRFPDEALALLADIARPSSSLDERLAVFHLTARIGTESAFRLWLDVARALPEDELVAHLTRVTLRGSLAAHLAARPRSHELLAAAVEEPCHPLLLDEFSRGVELAPGPYGLPVLLALLDRDEAGLPTAPVEDLIPRIDTLARSYPWVLGDAWVERLKQYLADPRQPVRYVAAGALERRPEALDELLGMLESGSDLRLIGIAHRALRASFGLGVGYDAEGWIHRVERERVWWETYGRDAAYELADLPAAEVAPVLRTLARNRLFRGRAAAIVAGELQFMQVDVARGVLAMLAELREPAAAPALVDALVRVDPELEGEVALTLEIVTGLRAGRDPQAWREALAL